jgi:hypothetical protein
LWRTKPTKLFPSALGYPTGGRWWLQKTPTPVKWKEKKLAAAQKKQKAFGPKDSRGVLLIMLRGFMINPDSLSGTVPMQFVRDFHSWTSSAG